MDDIGNLLYIAIAVLYFLYRAFAKPKGKGKKPVRKTPQSAPASGPITTTQPPKTKPLTFEDILRELAGEEKPKEPEVTYESEPYQESEVVFDYEEQEDEVEEELPTYRTEVQPVSGSRLASTEPGRLSPFKIEKRTSALHTDIHNTLSTLEGAKKAFILKEIFDRKY